MGSCCSSGSKEPFTSVQEPCEPQRGEYATVKQMEEPTAPENQAITQSSSTAAAAAAAPDDATQENNPSAPEIATQENNRQSRSDQWWSQRVEEAADAAEEQLMSARHSMAERDATETAEAAAAQREAERKARPSITTKPSATAVANPKHMTAGQMKRKLLELQVQVPEGASKEDLQALLTEQLAKNQL